MKTIYRKPMRHALAVLTAGLALGGLFAASAQTSLYRMQLSYPSTNVAPYNAGGGVPAPALLNVPVITSSNETFSWYGMMGWSTVLGSKSGGPFTNVIVSTEATNFSWSVTANNPDPTNNWNYVLVQTNSYSGQGNCSGCHGDKYTPWSKTPHAGAYNTLLSAVPPSVAFGAGCILCHSVGYHQPTGFTDITNTPQLANVGCESCHGPAGWHKNTDHDVIRPAVSMDPAICGSCHEDSHHPTYEEYATSGHALPSQPAATSGGCQSCHSANNRMVLINEYNDMLSGRSHPVTLYTGLDATNWTATCATCHDPHNASLAGQLRYPTSSTNFYTMPTTFDTRTINVTNNGVAGTASVNYNTVFDSVYNPKVQVCGQCHNTRGARWDGNPYVVITNTPLYGPVTNLAYVDIYCTNTVTQVFTNSLGVPYLTNSYLSVYVCGRYATTNVSTVQTNPLYSVGTAVQYVTYYVTNAGNITTNSNTAINSSGYGRVAHPTAQYNILTGNADSDYQNFVARKTHSHTTAPDQCTTCHVPNYPVGTSGNTNVTGHTFDMDYNGCLTSCHSTYTADALTAKITNLQFIETNNMIRVANMLNQWALTKAPDAIRTNYGIMGWEYTVAGAFAPVTGKSGPAAAFNPKYSLLPGGDVKGTNDNLQLQLPQDIRLARFDLYSAWNDKSVGVHNPSYVQALLDDAVTRIGKQFPAANFTVNSNAGFAPLAVTFTNYGGTGNTYSWTFGDGQVSSSANPVVIYGTPGIYTVICSANGTESLMKTNYIRVLAQPTISFVADNTNVALGTTVNFSSTSTATTNIFRWAWYPRFGVSGAANYATVGSSPVFSYAYTNAGTFSVELAAYCPGGANGSYNRIYVTNVNYINVVGASFVASATNVVAGTTVTFTNKSGGATSYTWSFGDGNTSTSTSPSNTYTNAGTYAVTLAATNNGVGSTYTGYIVVNPAPVAIFTGTPTAGVAPLTVTFSNTSSNATAYLWNFGNGSTSTNVNPSVTYTSNGTNTVTLQAIGSGATNTLTLTNYIVVSPLPVAGFAGAPTNGWSPLTVTFTNQSTNAASYVWNFGDGTTSTSASPVHTYTSTNSRPYTVTLQAINYGVTNSKTSINFIHVAVP